MIDARGNRPDVRNPILKLPVASRFLGLPLEARIAFRDFLSELAALCRVNAEHCWRKHKAPMALYWRVVGVWARHLSKLLRPVCLPEYRDHHYWGPVRYLATVDHDYVVVQHDGFVPVVIPRAGWEACEPIEDASPSSMKEAA